MNASIYCAHCGALNQPDATTCFACQRSLDEPVPTTDARRMMRGRYRLVRQLGVGGFGAVYQAEDTTLGNRLVALKEMSPRGLSPEEAKEATQTFQREALLLAGLSHPSLPRIYERFEEEGRWYLVMDFIEGETLEVSLDKQGGKLPVQEALQLALQLTEVLTYLHRRQPPIIFRDLKPSNIMRAPDGQVYLIDFGIARSFKPGQSKDTIAFGSPGYAAPEQYGKTQTTPRSDIFSLGAVLHQMLTGIDPSEKPFRFAPLRMPCPAGLPDLLEWMVRMDESQRPSSMDVIRRELERMLAVPPSSWRDDDLASLGAYIAPAGTPTGSWAATGPVVTPAGYSGPPIQHLQASAPAQPVRKKRGKWGWVVPIAMFALITWQVVSGTLSANQTRFGSYPTGLGTPATLVGDDATGTPAASPTINFSPTATPAGRNIPSLSLAWSPDGTQIASGGVDGTVALWNVATETLLNLNANFSGAVKTLAWSPNGRYLAAAGDDGIVKIWNAEGTLYRSYTIAVYISRLSWSPDNEHLVLGSGNGPIEIIDTLGATLTSAAITTLVTQNSAYLAAVAWSPDGQYIAVGGYPQPVEIWQVATRQFVYTDQGHGSQVYAVAWSPDSKQAVSAWYDPNSFDFHIEGWDALTGADTFHYGDDSTRPNVLAWSSDGSRIACGDSEGIINIWPVDNATPFSIVTDNNAGDVKEIDGLAWSPDSTRIASAGYLGTVTMWDALTGENMISFNQP